MAVDNELDEETDQDEEQAAGADDDSHSDDDGEGGEKNEPEPFLKIDDRTVYRDSDAAKKGWTHLKAERDAYRDLGKPEEIRTRLAQAEAREELLETLKSGTKNEQDKAEESYLATLSPQDRAKWEHSKRPMRELLKDEFATPKEVKALQDRIDKLEKQTTNREVSRFRNQVLGNLDELIEAGEKELDAKGKKRLERMVFSAMQNFADGDKEDEEGQELQKALDAEDHKRFAKVAYRLYFGEEAKVSQNGSQPRNSDGTFMSEEQVAKRNADAARQAAGEKASRLPKAPPKGGSAATAGGEKKEELPPIEKRGGILSKTLDRLWAEK
jgi:hypothetical protein